jgi:hypothetical protein
MAQCCAWNCTWCEHDTTLEDTSAIHSRLVWSANTCKSGRAMQHNRALRAWQRRRCYVKDTDATTRLLQLTDYTLMQLHCITLPCTWHAGATSWIDNIACVVPQLLYECACDYLQLETRVEVLNACVSTETHIWWFIRCGCIAQCCWGCPLTIKVCQFSLRVMSL